ncbi:MAG: MFS transporter [Chloroflexota bacterium]
MATTTSSRWLNRNVVAIGATSLLTDASHESATTVLPGFLAALGLPPLALGVIEGTADAVSSFVKLGSGWLGDRLGHRFGIAVGGYVLTASMPLFLAVATSWPLVLGGRIVGWLGRGIRVPVRDAILAESVPSEARGRAFGFHRAGDTIGAVVGPIIGVTVLATFSTTTEDPLAAFRAVFLLALIPGVLGVIAFAFFVRDPGGQLVRRSFRATLIGMPSAFRRFLVGVGLFGIGDFAPSLLILAATVLLTPGLGIVGAGTVAGGLYVLRNIVYAAASYPIGALSDRTGKAVALLALGYLIGAGVALGAVAAFAFNLAGLGFLALLFVGSGLLAAAQETLESVATADLGGPEARATSFGLLGTVNGLGDLIASAGLGLVWTVVSPVAAFLLAAAAMLAGAALVSSLARQPRATA